VIVTGSGVLAVPLGITLTKTGIRRRATAARSAPTRRSVRLMGTP
jgi:hypothetical protein